MAEIFQRERKEMEFVKKNRLTNGAISLGLNATLWHGHIEHVVGESSDKDQCKNNQELEHFFPWAK
jgi:hypothetical protein